MRLPALHACIQGQLCWLLCTIQLHQKKKKKKKKMDNWCRLEWVIDLPKFLMVMQHIWDQPNRALSLLSYLSHCILIFKVPFNYTSFDISQQRCWHCCCCNRMCSDRPYQSLISFVWLCEAACDVAERNFVFHRIMQSTVRMRARWPAYSDYIWIRNDKWWGLMKPQVIMVILIRFSWQ